MLLSQRLCDEFVANCGGDTSVVMRGGRIGDQVAMGNSPCIQDDGTNCIIPIDGAYYYAFPAECGMETHSLPTQFAPVATDSTRTVGGVVQFCGRTSTGTIGNCVGSIVDQCDADSVFTVRLD